MTVTPLDLVDLRDDLNSDFAVACMVLAGARMRQKQKDTPAHREAVTTCWCRIDAVLDLYLEMGGR
jgi:hypothetical protein